MSTKTIRIIQTVDVAHNETIERSWYDVVERTIAREIDTAGAVVSEEVVDERIVEEGLDLREETVSTDDDTEPDEIVEEVFEEDEE